jgi:hypothetical protein
MGDPPLEHDPEKWEPVFRKDHGLSDFGSRLKMLRDQRHRERSRRFFALFAAERSGWPGIRFYLRNPAQMLAPQHDSGALWISIPAPFFEERERT